jgi:pSer/pThr/pTyr-binding forkhead associated (FHA) protein
MLRLAPVPFDPRGSEFMKNTASRREYPCLVVHVAEGDPVRHIIKGREATIGREPTNDICIRDPLVSKHHARIIISNHSVTLFDLGSANKTRVNGQVVSQATLRYGDELTFARVKCGLVLAAVSESEDAPVPEGLTL